MVPPVGIGLGGLLRFAKQTLLVAGLGLLFSCSSGDETTGPSSPTWVVAERWVHPASGDQASIIWRVSAAAVHPTARLVVFADPQRGALIVTDLDGEEEWIKEHVGEAPEKVIRPSAVGFRGDSIWAWSFSGRRLVWLNLDGHFLGEVPFERRAIKGTGWMQAGGPPLQGGAFLLRPSRAWVGPRPGPDTVPIGVFQGKTGGDHLFDWVPIPSPKKMAVRTVRGGWVFPDQVFDVTPLAEISPDGALIAVLYRDQGSAWGPGSFGIRLFSPDGNILREIRSGFEGRRRLNQTVIEGLRNRYREWAESGDPMFNEQAWIDAMWKPEFLPPVSQFSLDEGGMWVGREGFHEVRIWERLDLQGAVLGSLALPEAFSVLAGGSEFILGSESDPSGRTRLVWYDLIKE